MVKAGPASETRKWQSSDRPEDGTPKDQLDTFLAATGHRVSNEADYVRHDDGSYSVLRQVLDHEGMPNDTVALQTIGPESDVGAIVVASGDVAVNLVHEP